MRRGSRQTQRPASEPPGPTVAADDAPTSCLGDNGTASLPWALSTATCSAQVRRPASRPSCPSFPTPSQPQRPTPRCRQICAGTTSSCSNFPGGSVHFRPFPREKISPAPGNRIPSGFTLDPDDLLSSDLAAYANERDSLAFSMSLDAVAHRIASDLYTDAIHGFQDWAVKMGDRIVLLPRSWDRPFYDRTRSSLPRITLGGPVTAKPDHVGRLFTSRRARRSRPAKGRLLHVARSPGGAAWEVAGRGRSRPSIRRRCA